MGEKRNIKSIVWTIVQVLIVLFGLGGGISGFLAVRQSGPLGGIPVVDPQAIEAQSYNVPIYTEQGGAKLVVGSGGKLEIQSGATLDVQSGADTTYDNMVVSGPTAVATATPILVVDSLGVSNILEVRDAATPVYTINDGGNVAHVGNVAQTGSSAISAPTAIATAVPALVVDSLGVSNILEVRDAATPVWTINNGGAVVQVGARTATGGDTVNNWSVVSAPTAIATATPAMVVDSLGVSNIFEVRDAATPVFTVNDGGVVVGQVVQYATAGQQVVVGTAAGVTETVVAAHGLTTVTFALCTLGEDVDTDAGDPVVCTAAVSGDVVTLSLWEDDWSAAGTAAIVHWLVIGTP